MRISRRRQKRVTKPGVQDHGSDEKDNEDEEKELDPGELLTEITGAPLRYDFDMSPEDNEWVRLHDVLFVRLHLLDMITHIVQGEMYKSELGATSTSRSGEDVFVMCCLQNNRFIEIAEAILHASIRDARGGVDEKVAAWQKPLERKHSVPDKLWKVASMRSANPERKTRVRRMIEGFLEDEKDDSNLSATSKRLLLSRTADADSDAQKRINRFLVGQAVIVPNCDVDMCWKLVVGANKTRDGMRDGNENVKEGWQQARNFQNWVVRKQQPETKNNGYSFRAAFLLLINEMQDWGVAPGQTAQRSSAIRWNTNLVEDMDAMRTRIIGMYGSFTRRSFLMFLHQESSDIKHTRHGFLHCQLPSTQQIRQIFEAHVLKRLPSGSRNAFWLNLLQHTHRTNSSEADIRTPDPRFFVSRTAHRDFFLQTRIPVAVDDESDLLLLKAMNELYEVVGRLQRPVSRNAHNYNTLAQFVACVWTSVMSNVGAVDHMSLLAKSFALQHIKRVMVAPVAAGDVDSGEDSGEEKADDAVILSSMEVTQRRNHKFFSQPSAATQQLRSLDERHTDQMRLRLLNRIRSSTLQLRVQDFPLYLLPSLDTMEREQLLVESRKLNFERCTRSPDCRCMRPILDHEAAAAASGEERVVDIVLLLPKHACKKQNNGDYVAIDLHRNETPRQPLLSQMVDVANDPPRASVVSVKEALPRRFQDRGACVFDLLFTDVDGKVRVRDRMKNNERARMRVHSALNFTVFPRSTRQPSDSVHIIALESLESRLLSGQRGAAVLHNMTDGLAHVIPDKLDTVLFLR